MVMIAIEPPPHRGRMARQRSLEFGRRFRELTAGQTQTDVADELGIGQATVSNMRAGKLPGREILERIITCYQLDREEWLALAGFTDQDPDEERLKEVARLAGEQGAETVLRRAGLAGDPVQQLVRAAQEILNRPETTYETEWDGPASSFDGYISQHDREIIKSIMAALIAEQRRKQGRA
jgi:transcriptional regulator with XRE-family HTH domain